MDVKRKNLVVNKTKLIWRKQDIWFGETNGFGEARSICGD